MAGLLMSRSRSNDARITEERGLVGSSLNSVAVEGERVLFACMKAPVGFFSSGVESVCGVEVLCVGVKDGHSAYGLRLRFRQPSCVCISAI